MNKDFYTVRDVAEELQVTEKAVRSLIKDGELIVSKVLGKWIITAENFKYLVEKGEQKSIQIENNQ